jgi:hypothetical protein
VSCVENNNKIKRRRRKERGERKGQERKCQKSKVKRQGNRAAQMHKLANNNKTFAPRVFQLLQFLHKSVK